MKIYTTQSNLDVDIEKVDPKDLHGLSVKSMELTAAEFMYLSTPSNHAVELMSTLMVCCVVQSLMEEA